MKKLYFLMLACCFGVIDTVHATNTDISEMANVIYIEPITAKSGVSDFVVSLKMKNTAVISAFQLDLQLPEGVTPASYPSTGLIKCTLASDRIEDGDDHSISVSLQSDGCYRVLCTSNNNLTFTGNDGVIATLKVNIAANMAVGEHPVVITYQKLNEAEMSKFYEPGKVETTLTITGLDDGRIHFDENATTLPVYTAGEMADVAISRTIKANEWSTLVLPFAMTEAQLKTAFGDDVQLADFTGYDTETEGENVTAITVNFVPKTAIEANHPYIIKVSSAITEFTVDGVEISPEDDPCVSFGYTTGKKPVVYHPKDFRGTYVADFDFYNNATSYPLFLSGNKFYYATEKTMHMKAFRAYFDFDDYLPEAENAGSRINMSFGDETTGIAINSETITHSGYFDLQGRLLKRPGKGVYISNGKKICVK